jgi:anti-sigma regulatory factor (Ser/Thr protein kinase)
MKLPVNPNYVSENSSDLTLELPCDQLAPSTVRHALARREDARWVMGDVMLVASELVTNAVRHSGCWPQDVVSVEVRLTPERVVCSVSDPGRSGKEAEPAREDELHGGFGLRVVEQLASRWGSERQGGGRYRVWAELACQPPRAG